MQSQQHSNEAQETRETTDYHNHEDTQLSLQLMHGQYMSILQNPMLYGRDMSILHYTIMNEYKWRRQLRATAERFRDKLMSAFKNKYNNNRSHAVQ